MELVEKNTKREKSAWGKYETVPKEWKVEELSEFLNRNMGQSPPSTSYNQFEEGLPFYQGSSDFGDLHPEPEVWCTEPKKIANENDILFTVRAPVGDINIAKSKCCIGRGVVALTPKSSDLFYCYYLVNHFKERFLQYTQGTTYDSINKPGLGRVKFPFTKNEKEQEKIYGCVL